MKTFATFLAFALLALQASAEPLRVFIRGGKKTHGLNAHEHERFLADWKVLLAERGMKVDGALDWPTAEQFKNTDVVIVHAPAGGDASEEQKALLAEFTKRGGGLVVIHAALATNDPAWWKSLIGGAWLPKVTQWQEGPMDLYFTENQQLGGGHPITRGVSNFHLDDEIYYDLDLAPDIRVLATSYTPKVREGKKDAEGGKAQIYDIQPQMWAYERSTGFQPVGPAGVPPAELAAGGTPAGPTGKMPVLRTARAFVTITGHFYSNFEKPNFRAILLRGIAWAGKRANVDEFTKPEEISALTYPPGGPQKPADTLASLEVHPDFTIKLVASEPLISKPMNFDWDPAGRLWVAETPEYPNGRRGMRPDYRGKEWKDHGGIDPAPGEQARKAIDKISILTDSDGDGVMDKKQVFYEGLELVTGLVFHRDGVIVTQAPDILWLRDTDGDGQADKVEKLYGGLGAADTHAVINNPRWGWDGWIYATHGYNGSDKVVNAKGEPMPKIGSGVVRFKPDGSVIEQYSSKGGNTWGLTITGDNRVLWTQPTSGALLNQVVLPESALARGKIGNTASFHTIIGAQKSFSAIAYDRLPYVQIDRVGDFTAAAGCAIYDGGAWPAEYHGDYFTTEPTINIIHHSRLKPAGSSYSAHKLPGREETEFIRSKDMWWRPIEVRVGPDGALYVGDFYNQAVIHNDTRGPDHNKVNAAVRPDRDHYFGRIWKIEHKQQTKLAAPDLSKGLEDEWVKALSHPNRHVRMNASRLLVENGWTTVSINGRPRQVHKLALVEKLLPVLESMVLEARIAALWTLRQLGSFSALGFQPKLTAALANKDAAVRRNAACVAEDTTPLNPAQFADRARAEKIASEFANAKLALLTDSDGQVRLATLCALAASELTADDAKALIAAWPKFDDDFQRSAAVGAASRNPGAVITAALDSADPASLSPLVTALTQNLDAEDAAKLVIVLAGKPASVDALKRSILEGITKTVKELPAMTPELKSALSKLLGSEVSGSALPLVAKWDAGSGDFVGVISGEMERMTITLRDTTAKDDARFAAATSLLGLRSANADSFKSVAALLGNPAASATLQKSLVVALGETNDPAAGALLTAAFAKLPADTQIVAFDVLLKRADWALAFLDMLGTQASSLSGERASSPPTEAGKMPAGPTGRMPVLLDPAAAYRLRTHPDKNVAKRATAMLEALNPLARAKNEVIAKLEPIVEQPGNVANGQQLFATACALCHKFGDIGADVGPALTGMGTHGPGELLTAIVDPNREVEPSFVTWNLETRDGQIFAGVIAAENPASITLKSLAGVQEVKTAALKTRTNTGRSLMPEGFEGLGGEALRDIIAYMQSIDGGKFRTVDLRDAFTASTARGLYHSQEAKGETIFFAKTGAVQVGGVPFNIVAPEKAIGGANVIVLKGGPPQSYAHTLPQRVEAKLGGFRANRLHFLGGVGGWAARRPEQGEPVLKVTVQYADGQTEELRAHNGVEFADYNAEIEVPGSKAANELVKRGQLRWFTRALKRTEPLAKLVLESFGGGVAPTLVAITAELADANAPLPRSTGFQPVGPVGFQPAERAGKRPADPTAETAVFRPQFNDPISQPPTQRPPNGPRVLLVVGGSSHDFVKFFGATDKATLAPHVGWVDFTQNANGVAPILPDIDVLVWSANQPISAETRAALMQYVNAGKALIAYHPGTWYAWKNFPEWNAQIVGGGARGHDKLGEFEVAVANTAHPIMAGVPAVFRITDELYWFNADPAGTPSEVLATATSTQKPGTYPQVFVVKHPKAKIVGLTLGHDARAHDLPAFQRILRNAVAWAAAK